MTVKTYKTKAQTLVGIELTQTTNFAGTDYPAGSMLMTDSNGKQFVMTKEQVEDKLDEVKPRTRNK